MLRSYCYIKFLEEGLLLDQNDHLRFESDFSNYENFVSKKIINNVFFDNKKYNFQISEEIYDRLLRPISFGYLEAITIHSLLDGSRYLKEKIGEVGGIYVAWVCYFDELCDKFPDLIAEITDLIDEKLLLDVINGNTVFLKNISRDVDKRIVPLLILWQEYIDQSRKLYNFSSRDDIWNDFVKTIASQYFQQIDYVSKKIQNFNSDLWEETKIRSFSPLWVNFLFNFLSKDTNKEFYLLELKDAILKIGEVAKIIDDIIDLSDDLYNRKWNYVLVKAYNIYPKIFDNIDKIDDEIDIIHYIIDHGLIDESIKDATMLYHEAIKDIKNLGLYVKDFELYVRLFLSNWFKSELVR